MRFYQVQPWRDSTYVITFPNPDPDKDSRLILRTGHELQSDGIGLGNPMIWYSEEACAMYANLLNKSVTQVTSSES